MNLSAVYFAFYDLIFIKKNLSIIDELNFDHMMAQKTTL